ncbi:MAG: glycosyltransferase family 39 protein [Lentisphaeria bacterium]|nr:glycosyltransferase family 39 protein [Lentisphaeria bacterium]MBR3506247.1 glycosyltransferase family 39 protein [Lentisphaeria bacterium]
MTANDHDKRLLRYLIVFMAVWLVLLTAIPSIFYTVLPLDTIETVMWSHPFSMGNAKHPPLAAWLAGLFTVVFMHTDFAMYLLSQVMLVIGFVYVYRLGKEFFSTEKAVFSVILLSTIIFYTFDSAKFNVNLPHMALWPMMTFYCCRGVKDDRMSDWILFGVASALSVLSKFFGFALLLALFLFILTGRETRRYFRRPGPYVAFAVFLLVLAPYIVWLVRNDFMPFKYVTDRVSEERLNPVVNFLTILGETLYPFAMPLLLLWLTTDHPLRSLLKFRLRDLRPSDPFAARLAVCVQFVPIALLTVMAGTGMMIDSMWAYPVYFITGFFLMAFWKDAVSPREFKKLFFTLMALFVFVQACDVCYWFTRTRNRGHFPAREFAASAQDFYREQTGRDITLAFGDMWYAGCVMQYLPHHPYAGSFEDPYDEFRFRSILDNEGALGVYLHDEDADELADALGIDAGEVRKNAKQTFFPYSAPYGREKIRSLFLVAIPPRKAAAQTARPQVQE